MNTRRSILAAAAMGILAFVLSPGVFAQSGKPIRMVVGFAAGGATDVIARMLAEKLRDAYPDGVIVENRVGANGLVGLDFVKNSAPDGTTLLFAPDFTFTIFPHSYRKLSFDPVLDFIPLAQVVKTRNVFGVGPAVPATVRTLQDFVQWCKSNPKDAAFASSGLGGGFHFMGIRLNRALGINMKHVPYKGGAPAMQDLAGGQIASSPAALGAVLPLMKAGKFRPLVTFSETRSELIPDVPTMVELGYKDFVVEQWVGVFAPAKTPASTVSKLNAAITDVLRSKDFIERTKNFGEVNPYTPAAFAALIKSDLDRWRDVVKASGYVAEE